MNDPAEALRAWIEANYTLSTAGVTASDVAFQTVDYNLEHNVAAPSITVQLAGFQRLQQAEPSLYSFTFIVQVSVFPQFRKTQSEVAALQGLYWEIVNHLKILFDAFEPEDIAGWESAYVDAGANAGIAVGSIPDEYLFNLTVKAQIRWVS